MSVSLSGSSLQKFYKNRREWSDVTPLKQDESPRGVVRIAYSEAFVDVHDYVRAVMKADEHSNRVMELTADALQMNAANYSVWAFRRNVMQTLNYPLAKEHAFAKSLLYNHPKNYQLWYHLQWLMEEFASQDDNVKDPRIVFQHRYSKLFEVVTSELDLINDILADDPKNYHAWQYRHWMVDYFAIPVVEELRFTEKMINEDGLNNSAWNHRFYTVMREGLTATVFDREMIFAVTQLKKLPHSECACNYLLGLISPLPTVAKLQDPALTHKRLLLVREALEDLTDTDSDGAGESPPVLGLLVDLFDTSIQDYLRDPSPSQETVDTLKEMGKSALNYCDRLAVELDRVRANFWRYRRNQIEETLKKLK